MIPKPAAVHQFHPGTAEGDAVTQQMLDLQRRLRRLGYRSEVYALQIPPALLPTIRHLDEYVAAPDQVLLLHHSIGNRRSSGCAALPEPKVLSYHNITPEEYFDSDVIREAIRLGRAQLQTLPPTRWGRHRQLELHPPGAARRGLRAGRGAAGADHTSTVFHAGLAAAAARDWLTVGSRSSATSASTSSSRPSPCTPPPSTPRPTSS